MKNSELEKKNAPVELDEEQMDKVSGGVLIIGYAQVVTYQCRTCGQSFSHNSRTVNETVSCPDCGSTDVVLVD